MNDIIVAAPDGTELRCMLFSEYDFEIGDEENIALWKWFYSDKKVIYTKY